MIDSKTKIQILEGSLRCYALGWLSLLPVFGVPLGIGAVAVFWRTWPISRDEQNPARRYLIGGLVLALGGLLVSGGLLLAMSLYLVSNYIGGEL